MTSFNIDLNEYSSKKPRVVRLLIFGAIICLAFTLSSLAIFLTLKSSLEWFFLIVAVYVALYIYFGWITFKTKLFVKADSKGIVFKFGIRTSFNDFIVWETVKKVRIGYAYITFFKKSGRRRKIQLGWLPYSKVIDIKDKVIEMCKQVDIEYEMADFIKYSKKIK